ncbi:hypothetical protein QR680_008352 [Steinernema hermaphroditum]|uniref:SSD domain-containing protein n=1 Tax=Steinernema hermaphroditum TaxID=289476 RepID=A0AA39M7Q3_9BILA|nr:hypothetical protein QR680_008352 [Steinernema hermaphroditum]
MNLKVHPENGGKQLEKTVDVGPNFDSRLTTPPSSSSASSDSSSNMEPPQEETRLMKAIAKCYRAWAHFIANHAVGTIIFCTILTIVCTIKIVKTPQENDIAGYTPYGARSRDEYEVRQEFFAENGAGVNIFVLVLAKDGGSLLRDDYLNETIQINDHVVTNFTILNHHTGQRESYSQFCYSFCSINEPIRHFYNGLRIQESRLAAGEALNERIMLNYPISTLYGRQMSLQPNFFGVTLANEALPSNTSMVGTISPSISNMLSSRMLALHYKAERVGGWTDMELKAYEMAISNYFQFEYKSERIRVLTLSTTFVESEVVRGGMRMLPFLIVGFAIMFTCSSITTFLSAAYFEQISIHKFSLAFAACVCPFMACGTALGLLFFAGVRFGSVLCVTPFLVLAIGVDDAYLMIHSWQRVSRRLKQYPVQEDSVGYRLAEVLTDTGPAILISASTNILADAVGSFTGSPEITLLCIGNMGALFVDFFFQITFYTAVMAVAGHFEIEAEKKQKNKLQIEIGDDNSVNIKNTCCKNSGTFHDTVKENFSDFIAKYVEFITSKTMSTVVCLLWIGFVVFSAIGISKLSISLTVEKLFSSDSCLIEMDHLRVANVIPHYTVATVFINNPGDLTDPKRLARLNALVAEMESLPESWGSNSTNYFLKDLLSYEKLKNEWEREELGVVGSNETAVAEGRTGFDAEDLPTFLKWPEYEMWRGFVKLQKDKQNNTHLQKFWFTTAYHGDRLVKWFERGNILHRWRQIVDKYKDEFNASVYHDDAIYLDLIDNMPTDTWQSALATLSCMAFICFVFMYNKFTVFVSSAAIASIMTGMLGILTWQGVSMDPIMMAAMIISIGFSVDIPAHVAYHYHSAGLHADHALTVQQRLRHCLSSVGFPALQAALSTNLCVLSLLFVPIYMSHIFVRIMCLCVILCIFHGLIIIPAVFAVVDRIARFCRHSRKRRKTLQKKEQSSNSTINESA